MDEYEKKNNRWTSNNGSFSVLLGKELWVWKLKNFYKQYDKERLSNLQQDIRNHLNKNYGKELGLGYERLGSLPVPGSEFVNPDPYMPKS